MRKKPECEADWVAREEADWNGEPFWDEEGDSIVYPEDTSLGEYLSQGPHEEVNDYRLLLTAVPKPPTFELRKFLNGYIDRALFEIGAEGEKLESRVNEFIASMHPLAHFKTDTRISVASMQAELDEYEEWL